MSEAKTCSVCKEVKLVSQFGSSGGGKYLQSHCRECGRVRSASDRAERKLSIREYDRKRRKETPRSLYNRDDKIRLWKATCGICLCCAKPIDLGDIEAAQIDHKEPLVNGGADAEHNLALAHAECNKSKHKKSLREHWQYRFNKGLDRSKLTEYDLEVAITQARHRERE